MMKRLGMISALLIVALLIAGCSPPNEVIQASMGREFSLVVGQTASIASEKLKIKFVVVTEDSRCPRDVVCIQAGKASAVIQTTKNGVMTEITLTETGGTQGNVTQASGEYKYTFNILPYPVSGTQVDKSLYQLVMTVAKP